MTNKSPILGARSAIGPVPTCGIETKAVGGFQSPRPSSKFTIHVARSGWVNRPVSIFQYPRSTNPPPQWSRKKGWQPLTASIRKEWQKTTTKNPKQQPQPSFDKTSGIPSPLDPPSRIFHLLLVHSAHIVLVKLIRHLFTTSCLA